MDGKEPEDLRDSELDVWVMILVHTPCATCVRGCVCVCVCVCVCTFKVRQKASQTSKLFWKQKRLHYQFEIMLITTTRNRPLLGSHPWTHASPLTPVLPDHPVGGC